MCDGEAYNLGPGDMMFVPKGNHIAYETDDECSIFYAAFPVNWKQLAGLTEVPGIDPDDMQSKFILTAIDDHQDFVKSAVAKTLHFLTT